jgi:hypothetical protein
MPPFALHRRRLPLSLLLCGLLCLPVLAQAADGSPEESNARLFMGHLRGQWDDIHDVIMRFHNQDPYLRGVAWINMDWRQGKLASASVDSNTTGDPALGPALIAAMKSWSIPGMSESWVATIPFKTEIRGSGDPSFPECGIFTGMVTDVSGTPIDGARLVLAPRDSLQARPDTAYTNREGVFICTLIKPGRWRLECSRNGYLPANVDTLDIEMGRHVRRLITLKT